MLKTFIYFWINEFKNVLIKPSDIKDGPTTTTDIIELTT